MTPAVEMRGITHKFGAFTALEDVSFSVEPGTVHALVGENGAGKTTLMRVLYGALQPTAGNLLMGREQRHWRNSADAISHGIGMVSQHYSIIPELTCLQNLILGAEGAYVLEPSSLAARADSLARKMGFDFDWHAEAATLSPSAAQKLEIVKLLWRSSRIMVLDEPTAMLSPSDSDALYASLRRLAGEGATVIVVTHRIPEVMQHCSRVTVLRGGRKVADREVAQTSAQELAELIVGHAVSSQPHGAVEPGSVVLDVRGLVVKGSRRDDAVKGATFSLRAGEMVGIAGVDGNGQRELFQCLVGTRSAAAGDALLFGEPLISRKTRERLAGGLRLIPEDRHEEGVIEDWSLVDNAALGLQRVPPLARGPWSDLPARAELAARVADRFKTRHSGLHRPMRSLSGGNQQRFVAARALELDPRLLLAFQPTRGLDIDGAAQVYGELRRTCREGAAALVVSFDLDELLENCDRVLVMHGGRVVEPAPGQEHDRQAIGRLMVGAQ
jgi:simple sugar transport system ATP-binding protein